jgi:hypothetical protein
MSEDTTDYSKDVTSDNNNNNNNNNDDDDDYIAPQTLNYEPLVTDHSFRLLKIHPNRYDDATIHVTLVPNEPHDLRLYTAISYEWGTESSTHAIIVNGETLYIRNNLHDFLLNYRKLMKPPNFRLGWPNCTLDTLIRWWEKDYLDPGGWKDYSEYIWIDQICINQNSSSERNHQVRLMSHIYTRAHHVLAWLGTDTTAERYLRDRAKEEQDELMLEESLNNFAKISYWKRLWIHQEILLGINKLAFMAGAKSLSRERLMSPTAKLPQSCPPILRELGSIDSERPHVLIKSGRFSLCYAICTFSSNLCGDPRDKIYGLLGIVEEKQRIDVDYRVSTREVFERSVRKILEIGLFEFGPGSGAGMSHLSRASLSRCVYLQRLQQMDGLRQRLEHLAENMSVQLNPGEVEGRIMEDYHQRHAEDRKPLQIIPTIREKLSRERWKYARKVISLLFFAARRARVRRRWCLIRGTVMLLNFHKSYTQRQCRRPNVSRWNKCFCIDQIDLLQCQNLRKLQLKEKLKEEDDYRKLWDVD